MVGKKFASTDLKLDRYGIILMLLVEFKRALVFQPHDSEMQDCDEYAQIMDITG